MKCVCLAVGQGLLQEVMHISQCQRYEDEDTKNWNFQEVTTIGK